MLFKKLQEKIYTVEVVIDALMNVLHDKGIVTKDEIQAEIFRTDSEDPR